MTIRSIKLVILVSCQCPIEIIENEWKNYTFFLAINYYWPEIKNHKVHHFQEVNVNYQLLLLSNA